MGEGVLAWVDRHQRALRLAILGGFAVAALLAAWLLLVEDDELFYASAAWLVAHGSTPYADFFFPQAPLTPYVYAPTQLLPFQPFAGRLLSVAMSVGAIALAMDAARRRAGPRAALLAGAGMASAAFVLLSAGWVHANPLAMLLVAVAAWALATRHRLVLRYGLAAAALALAAGARFNLVLALPLLALYAMAAERGRDRFVAVGTAVAAATPVLALLYVPFALADLDNLRYGLVGYHLLDGHDPAHSLAQVVKFKLDGLSYFGIEFAFLVAASLFLAADALARHGRRLPQAAWRRPLLAFYALATLAVLGASLSKTYVQARYLLVVLPFVAVGVGIGLDRVLARVRERDGRDALALLLVALLVLQPALALPHHVRTSAAHQSADVLQEAADAVRAHVPEGGRVLTQLPQVAAWSGREMVPGLETGFWGWYPEMPPEEARARHVMDAATALQLVQARGVEAVVRHDGDFRRTPFPTTDFSASEAEAWHQAFDQAMRQGYVQVARFEKGTAVEVWVRADLAAP